DRGGQVYFVHNRVDTLWEIAAKLQELVPRAARITVGHGQMSEGEREKVMLKVMHHGADMLVATTIIENGLDIPPSNTILINRAESKAATAKPSDLSSTPKCLTAPSAR